MGLQAKLLGALLLTYFVSRLALRLPNPLHRALGISLAHLLSLAMIVVLLVVLRGPAQGLSAEQILVFIPPQILWWLVDLFREHGLGFMTRRSRH